jgi:hypothetical protein
MKESSKLHSLSRFACGCIAALTLSASAFAQHVGGGFHGGYGGFHGGYGGFHGGYGWRGGFGWRGGYGFYPWGLGFGLGLYFATLPLYYSTIWWGGVPYYYADNTYYRWNGAVSQYETVAPPPGVQSQMGAQSPEVSELIAYPKNGQSQEQQGKDKFECHRWAAGQTGFDPTQAAGGPGAGRRTDYFRAQAACLEGRGYSVK